MKRTRLSSKSSARRIASLAGLLLLASLAGPLVGSAEAGYRLPWRYDGWRCVTQGWNGSYSHTGSMYYAYDFDHIEGEEVRCSMDGYVGHVKGDIPSTSCCCSSSCANDANYVTVDHNDGKATLYLHLRSVSVSVPHGIGRGDRVGAAGKTGWTCCSTHLHFQRQAQGIWFTNSTSIYFDEYPGTQLSQGSCYKSQNIKYQRAPAGAKASPLRVPGPLSVALDGEIVEILKASPLVRGWQGEELGLHFQYPGNVEPYLHVGATEEEAWPEYLPTWNLHFRVATQDGGSLPLDTQFEGYPGKNDLWALLTLKEEAGSMERIESLEQRLLAGAEVVIWRWENIAGTFVSAARVDEGGITMIHANIRGFDGTWEETRETLLEGFLLPQLARFAWTHPDGGEKVPLK